ncbi:hypothetical protein LPJ81_005188, partial [Coemansia sp. IMI 209127]
WSAPFAMGLLFCPKSRMRRPESPSLLARPSPGLLIWAKSNWDLRKGSRSLDLSRSARAPRVLALRTRSPRAGLSTISRSPMAVWSLAPTLPALTRLPPRQSQPSILF